MEEAKRSMSYWNYRVVRRVYTHGADGKPYDEPEETFGLHEVHYNSKGEVCGITVEEVAVHGDTLDGVRANFEMQRAALDKPVLDYDGPFADWDGADEIGIPLEEYLKGGQSEEVPD